MQECSSKFIHRFPVILAGLLGLVLVESLWSAPAAEMTMVSITTEAGDITVTLDAERAPKTVANFLRYVDEGFYDGGTFFRTTTSKNQAGASVTIQVIQATISSVRKGETFPAIELERTNLTGLRHKAGTISMARGGPDTATCEFFICIEDAPELDYLGMPGGKGEGFAAFGHVVSGMTVARKIHASIAEGQQLIPPIKIISARRQTLSPTTTSQLRLATEATALSFTSTASGLRYAITSHGAGPALRPGNIVIAHYVGTLDDGTVFDSSRDHAPFAFTLGKGQVIKGWDEAFAFLRVGDCATLILHPLLAYGAKERAKIPAYSTLTFDVEVVDVKECSLAELFRTAIEQEGPSAVQTLLDNYRAGHVDAYAGESQINGLGYRYLNRKEYSAAFAVLQANVRLFPSSSNAHDSLGECFLALDQKDAALAAYKKALECDPKAANAVKMITEISSAVER